MKQLAILLVTLCMPALIGCSQVISTNALPTPTPSPTPTPLSDIASFLTSPTNRFLVDLEDMDYGTPFRGSNSGPPHGAHIEFDNRTNKWPKDGTSPQNYPAIYAVADGYVESVDTYSQIGGSGGIEIHYKYSIWLAFARSGTKEVKVNYSIEPFVVPPSEDFYESFVLVNEGDTVQKGDVIAYMYIPAGNEPGDAHIHFDLITGPGEIFMAPSIFTSPLVEAFFSKYENYFGEPMMDGNDEIPPCMGYKIAANQNPFGTGAIDCL